MAKTVETPSPVRGFEGFSPGALDFFTELDEHQTRDWFLENKARYEKSIREPLARLVASLSLAFAAHDIPLMGDPKSSLFRINRDVRFSKDKRPYKTNASAVLTRDGVKRSQGLVYIHLAPEGCFAAAGFYALESDDLERFRRRIVSSPKAWDAVTTALTAGGLTLSRDDAAARLPRGYTVEQVGANADIIRLKSFIVRRQLKPTELGSPVLIDRVVELATGSQALLKFGWGALAHDNE
jgi:uncharacterized protein (TIGR02453 family)